MSVTNTVVFATSVSDAPQSREHGRDVGEHLARLRLDAASTMRAGRGVEADLAGEHQPVARAHRGRVRTGDGRRARRGDGFDGHRYLLSRRTARVRGPGTYRAARPRRSQRVPRGRRDGGEHRVGRTGARRLRDRRRSSTSTGGMSFGAQDAERADREVVHLAGHGVDREPLGTSPSRAPCARRRSRTSAARSRRAGRRAANLDARTPSGSTCTRACAHRRRDARVERVGASVSDASTPPSERARDEHRLLGQTDRAQRRRRRAARRRRLRASVRDFDADRRRPHRDRTAAAARATTPSISTRAVVRTRDRGDRRTLRAEPHDVFARVHDAHRRARAGRRARARRRGAAERCLPPNAPPFASGDAGSPPGAHHDASGSRYAGSTHDVASATPSGGRGRHAVERAAGRSSTVVRRPCTLRGARAAPRRATRRRPSAAPAASTASAAEPGGSGTATSASRGAVSSANGAPPSGTSAPTRLRRHRPRARPAATRGARDRGGPAASRSRAIASRTVSQPVHRHRCAASARSTSRARSPDERA